MVIKSRRQAGQDVDRMEEGRAASKILTDKYTGKRPLGRLEIRRKAILEYFLKK